jgi:hypothetical protein
MARDLDDALTDISAIRSQLARTTLFQGYGPVTVAATGVLAFVAAALQAAWLPDPAAHVDRYLLLWTTTAFVCVVLVFAETVARARRVHGDLAQEMLWTAIEQFTPATVTGGLVTLLLHGVAPEASWMLPALWQLFVALGVFASHRFLPAGTFWVGAWYLACGLATLAFARGAAAFSPLSMAMAFGVGQLLTAAILYRHREAPDDV